MASIRFLGAARNVTGSRYLVESGASRILIDCGLYQERDLQTRNWEAFPVDPKDISHVVLTHGHLDHCGYLPRLFRQGFNGQVVCTPATAEIAEIVMLDSAHLQQADAEFKRKRHKKEGRTNRFPVEPLYTEDDVNGVTALFRPQAYDAPLQLTPDIRIRLRDAGHIIGSASVECTVTESGVSKTCVFSGDLGGYDRPILRDPSAPEVPDCIVMESTYGDRVHDDTGDCGARFTEVINDTATRGGNIVIPVFSVGRAQEVLYHLASLLSAGKIPPLPCFLDSPMAARVTAVHGRHRECFDREALALLEYGQSIFSFAQLKTPRTGKDSQKINDMRGTSIIMAGAGMCNGGRVKHHLVHNINRTESTILFVGYQASGTLGRTILGKPDEVRIFGRRFPVRARIEKIDAFSAHADRNDLLRWVDSCTAKPGKIFVTHGEESAALAYAGELAKREYKDVTVPAFGEKYEF